LLEKIFIAHQHISEHLAFASEDVTLFVVTYMKNRSNWANGHKRLSGFYLPGNCATAMFRRPVQKQLTPGVYYNVAMRRCGGCFCIFLTLAFRIISRSYRRLFHIWGNTDASKWYFVLCEAKLQ